MKCQVHHARHTLFAAECSLRSKHGVSFNPASSLPPPHSCYPGLRIGTQAAGYKPLVTATMHWERNQARGSNRKRKWRRGGTREQLEDKGRAQRHREAWKRTGSTETRDFNLPLTRDPCFLSFLSNFSIFLPLILSMARPSTVGAAGHVQWRNRRSRTHARAGRGNHPCTRVSQTGSMRTQWQQ